MANIVYNIERSLFLRLQAALALTPKHDGIARASRSNQVDTRPSTQPRPSNRADRTVPLRILGFHVVQPLHSGRRPPVAFLLLRDLGSLRSCVLPTDACNRESHVHLSQRKETLLRVRSVGSQSNHSDHFIVSCSSKPSELNVKNSNPNRSSFRGPGHRAAA